MPSIQRHSQGLQTLSSKNSEIQTLTTLNDGLTWQHIQRQFTLTWFWYLHKRLNFNTVFAAGHKNVHISAKRWTACTSHSTCSIHMVFTQRFAMIHQKWLKEYCIYFQRLYSNRRVQTHCDYGKRTHRDAIKSQEGHRIDHMTPLSLSSSNYVWCGSVFDKGYWMEEHI